MYVNLLPHAFRRELLVRQRLSLWTPIWATCLCGVFLYLAFAYIALLAAQQSLAKSESLCEPLRLIAMESTQVEDQLKVIQGRKAELQSLAPTNKAVPILIIVSDAARSLEGKVQLRRLTFHHSVDARPTIEPAASASAEGLAMEKGQLTLEAVAANDAAIASFVESLRSAKVIRQVELKSSTEWNSLGRDCRKFDVLCQF